MSDSDSSDYDDDKSIGDCTMYEATSDSIIKGMYDGNLTALFLEILKPRIYSAYDFSNARELASEEKFKQEYEANNIDKFKQVHSNHYDDTKPDFYDGISAKFQLLYLIINKYNQNMSNISNISDDKTADIDDLETELKKIPSIQDVEIFFNINKIGEHTGKEVDTSNGEIVSALPSPIVQQQQPPASVNNLRGLEKGPPMLQEQLKEAQAKCNSRKRSRSPPPKGGKRKTRKVLKRIPKVLKWRDLDPPKKTLKSFKKKHGNKCFLRPKELKYPICDKYKGKVNCKGLLAAHNRGMLSVRRGLKPKKYSYKKLAKTARKVAKKHKCNWVLKKSKKSKK
jgi:hypothetical protein